MPSSIVTCGRDDDVCLPMISNRICSSTSVHQYVEFSVSVFSVNSVAVWTLLYSVPQL